MNRECPYSLVEGEVFSLLNQRSLDDISQLRNEVQYRLDIGDETIDAVFMKTVLNFLNSNGVEKIPPISNLSAADMDNSLEGTVFVSELTTTEKRLLEEEIRKGLEEDEEVFKSTGREFNKPERSKYRSDSSISPRLPKFYNKVKSGVVWNKYAQTHFDEDNPPPKQVLGYKFSIFYPDLVDASKAPRYKLEACETSTQHIILRFMAGAPYEDLAFKILNKEWDLDRRSGFSCQFERRVLQLHFSFKRDRYRR